MIVTFSVRHLRKKINVLIIIILLLAALFYVFSVLAKLIWPINSEEKMRQQYLLEKPLRVLHNVTTSC